MARLKPLVQPTNDTCGQTCIAMLAGVKVDTAIANTRAINGCVTADLVRGLDAHGIKHGTERRWPWKRNTANWKVPDVAIITLAPRNENWYHAVVLHNGKIYDPALGVGIWLHHYIDLLAKFKAKFVDYIIVYKDDTTWQDSTDGGTASKRSSRDSSNLRSRKGRGRAARLQRRSPSHKSK